MDENFEHSTSQDSTDTEGEEPLDVSDDQKPALIPKSSKRVT